MFLGHITRSLDTVLQEMSVIFERASIWNPYNVVRIERKTPRRYDTKGKLIVLDLVSDNTDTTVMPKSSTEKKNGRMMEDTRMRNVTNSAGTEV